MTALESRTMAMEKKIQVFASHAEAAAANRAVVYQNGRDITDEIIAAMNARPSVKKPKAE